MCGSSRDTNQNPARFEGKISYNQQTLSSSKQVVPNTFIDFFFFFLPPWLITHPVDSWNALRNKPWTIIRNTLSSISTQPHSGYTWSEVVLSGWLVGKMSTLGGHGRSICSVDTVYLTGEGMGQKGDVESGWELTLVDWGLCATGILRGTLRWQGRPRENSPHKPFWIEF